MGWINPKPNSLWKIIALFFGALMMILVIVLLVSWVLSTFGTLGKILASLLLGGFLFGWVFNLLKKDKEKHE